MKVSEIETKDLINYMRLDDLTEQDEKDLQTMLSVARTFVIKYTGRTMDELDELEDIPIVIYVLVQDMWDNRTLYVDKTNLNRVVDAILGMHAVNYL